MRNPNQTHLVFGKVPHDVIDVHSNLLRVLEFIRKCRRIEGDCSNLRLSSQCSVESRVLDRRNVFSLHVS